MVLSAQAFIVPSLAIIYARAPPSFQARYFISVHPRCLLHCHIPHLPQELFPLFPCRLHLISLVYLVLALALLRRTTEQHLPLLRGPYYVSRPRSILFYFRTSLSIYILEKILQRRSNFSSIPQRAVRKVTSRRTELTSFEKISSSCGALVYTRTYGSLSLAIFRPHRTTKTPPLCSHLIVSSLFHALLIFTTLYHLGASPQSRSTLTRSHSHLHPSLQHPFILLSVIFTLVPSTSRTAPMTSTPRFTSCAPQRIYLSTVFTMRSKLASSRR